MTDWLDLKKLIPELGKTQCLHVVNADADSLIQLLSGNDFHVFALDGSKITDVASFFHQAKLVFKFPGYFGNNWDAWNDCLGDFEQSLKGKTALIWKDADATFATDAQTFIQAVFDLYNMALSASINSIQVELFLVGNSHGFKSILKLDQIIRND